MVQSHCEQAMYSFKYMYVDVLVASMKLSGRGVNVDGVTDLVFWNLPDILSESISYGAGEETRIL